MNAHWVKCFFSTSTLHCLTYFTVRSVSTRRHRHQLVRCPVWLSGCQSVRNSQPPGEISLRQIAASYMHDNLHGFTCAAVCQLRAFALNHLNHKWMNEWIMYWVLNHRHYGVHSVISSLLLWRSTIFLGCHFLTTSCTIFIITSSIEDPGLALQVLLV